MSAKLIRDFKKQRELVDQEKAKLEELRQQILSKYDNGSYEVGNLNLNVCEQVNIKFDQQKLAEIPDKLGQNLIKEFGNLFICYDFFEARSKKLVVDYIEEHSKSKLGKLLDKVTTVTTTPRVKVK